MTWHDNLGDSDMGREKLIKSTGHHDALETFMGVDQRTGEGSNPHGTLCCF